MTGSDDRATAPIDMVNLILTSDITILGVSAIDRRGNNVGSAWKAELPESAELNGADMGNKTNIVGLIMSLVDQSPATERLRSRGFYGELDSVVINFRRAKLLVLPVPELGLSFAVRLARSANADYIRNQILLRLGVIKYAATETRPSSGGQEQEKEGRHLPPSKK